MSLPCPYDVYVYYETCYDPNKQSSSGLGIPTFVLQSTNDSLKEKNSDSLGLLCVKHQKPVLMTCRLGVKIVEVQFSYFLTRTSLCSCNRLIHLTCSLQLIFYFNGEVQLLVEPDNVQCERAAQFDKQHIFSYFPVQCTYHLIGVIKPGSSFNVTLNLKM